MDLRKHLDNAIERYGSGTVPQTILGSASAILGAVALPAALIPIGLQAALNERIGQIQQKRIEEGRAKFGEHLAKLDGEKVDAAFVESDSFFDFVREVFDRVRKAEDKEKLEALINTFVNGLLVGQSSSPFRDIVLRRLGEMSPHHVHAIQVWGQVAKPLQSADNLNSVALTARQASAPFARREDYRAALAELADPEFDVLINDLITMGVLANWYPEGTFGGMAPMERVGLTDLGSALIRYMTDPTSV